MDPLIPLRGASVIDVRPASNATIQFSQLLTYEYEDRSPALQYHHDVTRVHGFADRERATLARNLQGFLDDEINVVNGQRAWPVVHQVGITFNRGRRFPSFSWQVSWQGPDAGQGAAQAYEARVEPATLEYDVKSTYNFPAGSQVVEITSSLAWTNDPPNIIEYTARKGERVGRVEAITWRWP